MTNVDIKIAIDLELISIHESQRRLLISACKLAIKALIEEINYGQGTSRVNAANSILDRAGLNSRSFVISALLQSTRVDDATEKEQAISRFLDGLAATGIDRH